MFIWKKKLQKIVYSILVGVAQVSVLWPVLYTIFTADFPVVSDVQVATYPDDTAIIASQDTVAEVSQYIQNEIVEIERWLKKWNIKVSTEKSKPERFSLRRGEYF